MTHLSAKQQLDALSQVIEMAEDSLEAWINHPNFNESKWQEAVTSLYHAKIMRANFDA